MSASSAARAWSIELLQRLRLLLFRDGAYDGFTHDIAVAVNHIGGGIGKDVGGKLSRLTIGVKIHILIGAPFLASTSFASEIAAFVAVQREGVDADEGAALLRSSLFSASSSESSPTQGLQVVNQKFTTVTALAENSSSLFTVLPSRSLPSKAGNFCICRHRRRVVSLPAGMLHSRRPWIPAFGVLVPQSVSWFSISRIFSPPPCSSFSSRR